MRPDPPALAASRYLAILAFDIRHFSAFTDTQRTRIATEFRDSIETAFREAGLEQVWESRMFCQNSGDGIVTGFDHRYLHGLVDKLPAALQHRLRQRFQQTGLNVRMRLGIAVGPVQWIDDDRVDVAPNQTVIDACRLCDALPTRMLLERSEANATFLAVAVSAAVMTSAIEADPQWLHPREFVRAGIEMEEKDYHAEAFLHVPSPSGDLLEFGLVYAAASSRAEQSGDEPLESLMQRGLGEIPPTSAPHNGQGQARHVGRDDRSVRNGTSISVGRDVGGDVIAGDRIDYGATQAESAMSAAAIQALREQLDAILRGISAAEQEGQLATEAAAAASREIVAARNHADRPGIAIRSLSRCRTFLQEATGLAGHVAAVIGAFQGLR